MKRHILFTYILFTIALLAAASSIDARAQGVGYFIDQGLGLSAGFTSAEGGNEFSLAGGYLVSPTLEVGATLAYQSFEDVDANATTVGPFVGFYPVQQTEELPINLRLGAGVGFVSIGGDDVEDSITGNQIVAQGDAFYLYEASPALQLVPRFGVGFVRTDLEDQDAESEVFFEVAASALFEAGGSGSNRFAVTPRLQFIDGETNVGLLGTFLIP